MKVEIECKREGNRGKTFTVNLEKVLVRLGKDEEKRIKCPYCGHIGFVAGKRCWYKRDTAKPTKGHSKVRKGGP